MREIASVLGLPDKPMEVEVPKDIVRSFRTLLDSEVLIHSDRVFRPCHVTAQTFLSKLHSLLRP